MLTYYGFAGCYGSCYGSYTNYFSYWTTPPAAYGYGMPMYPVAPAAMPPVNPAAAPANPAAPGVEVKPKGQGGAGIEFQAPATVTISIPADATLLANGQFTTQTSAERKFVTPVLTQGQNYHYEFTATMIRDGQVVTETKKVAVWAGGIINVDFGTMATAKVKDENVVISPK
jgi:uncharacterized protein (TIGR03000 family)